MADPEAQEATILGQIGGNHVQRIEATGDIVWAIDTRRGDLESLLARIRRFAGDLLEARGVSVVFAAPPRAAEIVLHPEMKRELYLVLKEALHNVAEHAQAREVWIEVVATGGGRVAEDARRRRRVCGGQRPLRQRPAQPPGARGEDQRPARGRFGAPARARRVGLSLRL